ncbi:MAG: hypothetical protein Fur0032_14880 [Terrimicrobiaceae bacterium]
MRLAAPWLAALALLATPAWSQSNRSLTDSEWTRPLPQPGIGIPPPVVDDPTRALREQILLLRNSIKGLSESLAAANSEAEAAKRENEELSMRLDALGIPGIAGQPDKVEQRLVSAVRDLRVQQKQNEEARTQLIRLVEAVQLLVATTAEVDPDIRAAVETEIRKANEVLGASMAPESAAVEATLTDALVVDTKDELSLIIMNVGEQHGVRIGMPFQVWRHNRKIGEVRVVDVRAAISGAIIQNLENETTKIKTGDRLKVDAKK